MTRTITFALAALVVSTLAAVCIYHNTALAVSPAPRDYAPKDDKPAVDKTVPKLVFMPTKDQIMSEEIFGTWKADNELTKRIDGSYKGCDVLKAIPKDEMADARFVFTKDEEATKKYERFINELLVMYSTMPEPEELEEKEEAKARLEGLSKVWATGRYDFGTWNKGKGVFGLISVMGMQAIVYFPDREDGKGKIEGSFLQIARDPKGDKDILVHGGEDPDDPSGFMVRVIDNAKGEAKADNGKSKEAKDAPAPAPAK